jgi:hypothetical protein
VVDCIAEGTGGASSALRDRLHTLEREADAERRALTLAESVATKVVKLPTPNEMVRIVFDLERRAVSSPMLGRVRRSYGSSSATAGST